MSTNIPEHHLSILTLNIGHGRGKGFHQILTNQSEIKNNLQNIATILQKYNVDIAGFQEIDGRSFWSGNLDHSKFIATSASYKYITRGTHVKGLHLDYGTSIVSKYPFVHTSSTIFQPSPPLPNKGFVWTDIDHPAIEEGIRIISLHLDFARAKVRRKQLEEVSSIIEDTDRKVIVLGDFNMSWTTDMNNFCTQHHLKAFAPESHMPTFPKTNMRLDWILIPKEFVFAQYYVLTDKLSDHRAVIAFVSIP